MTKDQVISMAQKYSKSESDQKAYIAGIQAACNIIRQKTESCYNDEFCSEMESLSEVCFIEFD